jgi:hypothetical protein
MGLLQYRTDTEKSSIVIICFCLPLSPPPGTTKLSLLELLLLTLTDEEEVFGESAGAKVRTVQVMKRTVRRRTRRVRSVTTTFDMAQRRKEGSGPEPFWVGGTLTPFHSLNFKLRMSHCDLRPVPGEELIINYKLENTRLEIHAGAGAA